MTVLTLGYRQMIGCFVIRVKQEVQEAFDSPEQHPAHDRGWACGVGRARSLIGPWIPLGMPPP